MPPNFGKFRWLPLPDALPLPDLATVRLLPGSRPMRHAALPAPGRVAHADPAPCLRRFERSWRGCLPRV